MVEGKTLTVQLRKALDTMMRVVAEDQRELQLNFVYMRPANVFHPPHCRREESGGTVYHVYLEFNIIIMIFKLFSMPPSC